MRLPERVRVVEVGPRDGLQNESRQVSTADKLALIAALADAGLAEIEATAFVHPKWTPAMADAERVMAGLPRRPGLRYDVLVPNVRGYERARGTRPDGVALVCSASQSHNKANLNRTTEESLAELRDVAARARADGFAIRGTISTSFWCPFEGRVPEERVLEVAKAYAEMGVDEVVLADTLGAADPRHVGDLAGRAIVELGLPVALHLHDTYGMGLASALAGLEAGVEKLDSSVGGLGGCPHCPGAAGNLATEDLVHMLAKMGIETGVDPDRLDLAGDLARELVGHELSSRLPRRTRVG